MFCLCKQIFNKLDQVCKYERGSFWICQNSQKFRWKIQLIQQLLLSVQSVSVTCSSTVVILPSSFSQDCRNRGWEARAAIPIIFLADQLTLSQPRGRLCPPNPYLPNRISRPSYGPAHISAVNEPTFLVVLGGGRDGIWFVCSNFQGNEFWKIGLKLRKFRQRRMILWEMTAVNHLSRNHPLVQLFSLAVEVWTYFPSKNIYRMNRGTCFYTRSF